MDVVVVYPKDGSEPQRYEGVLALVVEPNADDSAWSLGIEQEETSTRVSLGAVGRAVAIPGRKDPATPPA